MNRHQIEARIWVGLRDLGLDRKPLAPNVVANLLDYADQYAATTGGLVHERRADTLAARQELAAAAMANEDTPLQRAMRRRTVERATSRKREAS